MACSSGDDHHLTNNNSTACESEHLNAIDTLSPIELQQSIKAQLSKNPSFIGKQWLCLKYGQTKQQDSQFLSIQGDNSEYTNLKRLNIWVNNLYSILINKNREQQIIVLEKILDHFPSNIPSEKTLLAYGIQDLKSEKMKIKIVLKGFSLSSVYDEELENIFIIK